MTVFTMAFPSAIPIFALPGCHGNALATYMTAKSLGRLHVSTLGCLGFGQDCNTYWNTHNHMGCDDFHAGPLASY